MPVDGFCLSFVRKTAFVWVPKECKNLIKCMALETWCYMKNVNFWFVLFLEKNLINEHLKKESRGFQRLSWFTKIIFSQACYIFFSFLHPMVSPFFFKEYYIHGLSKWFNLKYFAYIIFFFFLAKTLMISRELCQNKVTKWIASNSLGRGVWRQSVPICLIVLQTINLHRKLVA